MYSESLQRPSSQTNLGQILLEWSHPVCLESGQGDDQHPGYPYHKAGEVPHSAGIWAWKQDRGCFGADIRTFVGVLKVIHPDLGQ